VSRQTVFRSLGSVELHQKAFLDRSIKSEEDILPDQHSKGSKMNTLTETELIGQIVEAVYPFPNQARERYHLIQSLNLLLFLSKRRPKCSRDHSLEAMRNLLNKTMYGNPPFVPPDLSSDEK
jgi:hypothetical protein